MFPLVPKTFVIALGSAELPAFPSVHKYLPAAMPVPGTLQMRELWSFDDWVNLNHGSYGAVPSAVQSVQHEWVRIMEANPERFLRWDQYSLIDKARGRIAEYIGAQVEDVVFVDNASHGMNAVLRSLAERLPAEALVLDLSLAYTMVKNTLHYSFGDRVVQVNLTLTSGSGGSFIGDDGIVQAVRKVLETHKGAIKLLSVSHITSLPAIVLPVAELAALAHSHGALIVADGAHALGQITLDVPSLGVDFYVANGHKWLPSPKGSAVLWVARAHQSLVYPTTISQEGQGSTRFVRDFSYQGTDDPTAWLSMVASLDFRSSVPGGEEAVIDYVARLATEGGALLARMWKTELLLPAGRASLRGSMVNVRMPTSNGTAALAMNGELLEKYHTWVPCFAGEPLGLPPSTYWCRVSAFLYNNISDFEMLGDAVLRILARSPDEY